MGELEGIRGAWGYPQGGMGGVSSAIAKSALASGAQIFTNCEASIILRLALLYNIMTKVNEKDFVNCSHVGNFCC